MPAIETVITNMCMIYDDEGNVLVQDRVNPDWPGVTFPGGHVEIGESFVDSTIREIKEETGLDIDNLQICGTKEWTNKNGTLYIVLLYKTNSFRGDIVSSDEGKVYWVKMDELKNQKLTEGMENMIEVFVNDYINEYYYIKVKDEWKDVLR